MTTAKEKPVSNRKRWLAVLLATLIMLLSYGMVLFAFVAGSETESTFAGGVLGIGLGLVPLVFVVAGFVSRNEHTVRRALIATGIWLGITISIGIIDLPTALVAGFGAGGIVCFRQGEKHSWQARAVAVAAAALYTFALQRISPQAGLFGGAALPFVAIAVADIVTEKQS